MKNDFNGLVEQCEMDQSVDENFNTLVPTTTTVLQSC
jgi:hypothetical protein